MRKIVALALIASLYAGCFTMKYVAPVGTEVSTLSELQPASFEKQVKVWYALWGLVPITDNSSDAIISRYKLKEVRVTTKFTFLDLIIGAFTGVATIVPKTMVIEGNP